MKRYIIQKKKIAKMSISGVLDTEVEIISYVNA